MITGTNHFVSLWAAQQYYAMYRYRDVAAAVDRKILEGEIVIGQPELQPGQRLVLVDDGLRYAVCEAELRRA